MPEPTAPASPVSCGLDDLVASTEAAILDLQSKLISLRTQKFARDNPSPLYIGQWVKYMGRRLQITALIPGIAGWFVNLHSPTWTVEHASGRKTLLPGGMAFRNIPAHTVSPADTPIKLTKAARRLIFE